MSAFDYTRFEGQIVLADDDRRGIWASQTRVKGALSVRNAGTLPTVASAHSLLTVSLTNSLRGITKRNAAWLSENAGVSKPRILVTATDPTFLDALQAKIVNDKHATRQLRAGKNFLMILAQQIARFDLTFHTDVESKDGLSLKSWARTNVLSPSAIRSLPATLIPSVISTTR